VIETSLQTQISHPWGCT